MGPQLRRNLEELQSLQEELTWSNRPSLPVKALDHLPRPPHKRAKALPSSAPIPGALGAAMGLPQVGGKLDSQGDAALQALVKASADLQKMSGTSAQRLQPSIASMAAFLPLALSAGPRSKHGGHFL